MAAAIVLPLLGLTHVPDADVDALAAAAEHHSRPQFERVIEPSGDDHCLACHLLRAMSGADAGGLCAIVQPPRLIHASQSPTAVEARRIGHASPPRAPPVLDSALTRLRPASLS